MFQFPGFPCISYLFTYTWLYITTAGFLHSDICGSSDICSLPQLFAACHVLLRLLVPRHSPCALLHLTSRSYFQFAASLLLTRSSVTYLSTCLHRLLARLASIPKILRDAFSSLFESIPSPMHSVYCIGLYTIIILIVKSSGFLFNNFDFDEFTLIS